jgi:hypothetical protein
MYGLAVTMVELRVDQVLEVVSLLVGTLLPTGAQLEILAGIKLSRLGTADALMYIMSIAMSIVASGCILAYGATSTEGATWLGVACSLPY